MIFQNFDYICGDTNLTPSIMGVFVTVRKGSQTRPMSKQAWDLLGKDKKGWVIVPDEAKPDKPKDATETETEAKPPVKGKQAKPNEVNTDDAGAEETTAPPEATDTEEADAGEETTTGGDEEATNAGGEETKGDLGSATPPLVPTSTEEAKEAVKSGMFSKDYDEPTVIKVAKLLDTKTAVTLYFRNEERGNMRSVRKRRLADIKKAAK